MAFIIPPSSSSPSLALQLGLHPSPRTTAAPRTDGKSVTKSYAKEGPGLAISDALRIKLRSLAFTERNTNDVIAMAKTADGALEQMGGLLERMRDLAVENAGGKLTDQGREETRLEILELQAQVDGIQKSAIYDGRPLLSAEVVEVGVDVTLADGASDRLVVTLGGLDPMATAEAAGVPTRAPDAMVGRIDDALATIANQRARFGAAVNRFTETAIAVQAARTSRTAGSSPLDHADAAAALANFCKVQISRPAEAALLTQANQLPAHGMNLLRD